MHIPYVSFYGQNGGELLPTDAARVLDLEVDQLHVLPQVGTASEGADHHRHHWTSLDIPALTVVSGVHQ